MNIDMQTMLAHQLLLDADVFKDPYFGAKDCRVCIAVTIAKAGLVASKIVYTERNLGSEYHLPSPQDARWNTDEDIVAEFSETVRAAHSRHRTD